MVYFPASGFSHSLEESARTYTPELSRFFQRVEGSGHELTYREHSSYRLDAKARRLASMAHAITTARNTNPQCAPDWVAVTDSASLAEPCPACATPRNTAMTVVATAPESCWNVLNSAHCRLLSVQAAARPYRMSSYWRSTWKNRAYTRNTTSRT